MIRIQDLSISFDGKEIFSDVNFHINPKEKIGLIGRNGSGKSTLLGLCAGLDDADSGQILLCSQELNKLNEDERAALRLKNTSFIFQSC